jgi:hypothetical protein
MRGPKLHFLENSSTKTNKILTWLKPVYEHKVEILTQPNTANGVQSCCGQSTTGLKARTIPSDRAS